MDGFLGGTMLLVVAFGVSGASSPMLDVASMLTPLEAARMAIEDYNEGTGVPAVFRLLKLRNTHKTRFGWGVHFSMNFTVKETHCQKASSFRMGDCRYKPNGVSDRCVLLVSASSVIALNRHLIPDNHRLISVAFRELLKCSLGCSFGKNGATAANLTGLLCIGSHRANSGGRKKKSSPRPQMMEASPPQPQVEYYYPSSYSTAALKAVEAE
ncbi:hypothetical protein JD844_003775 [Phrynosoma platyrhinos]|uniref:Vipericidin n=1 Tax=Phrynosoma platyrhinos TaxID=52577 RepID=A0ABQ7TDU7_PHRPL|nr:hypothetical protein JD844_003775 [Phrynosoma platyrhinos]